MNLDRLAEAESAIELLVLLSGHLRSAGRPVVSELYGTPPEPREVLVKDFAGGLEDDELQLADRRRPQDPIRVAEVRRRLCEIAEGSSLSRDVVLMLMAHAIANDMRVDASRLELIEAYYLATGRSIGHRRYRLLPGDPVPASVYPNRRLPAGTRLDRYRGICFVPPAAGEVNLVCDLTLANVIDPLLRATIDSTRRQRHPKWVATAHPFCFGDYRRPDEAQAPGQGPAFPIVPFPSDEEQRLVRLHQSLNQALDSNAPVIVFPELVGTRRDVEGLVQVWDEKSSGPALLVAGSFHEQSTERGRANVAIIAGRDGDLAHKVEVTKNNPVGGIPGVRRGSVHGADPVRLDRREGIDMPPEATVTLFTGAASKLAVLICKDAADPALLSLLTDLSCNLIVVPAWTPKTVVFEAAAGHTAEFSEARFVLANAADFRAPTVVAAPRAPARPADPSQASNPALLGTGALTTVITAHAPGTALLDFSGSGDTAWTPLENEDARTGGSGSI